MESSELLESLLHEPEVVEDIPVMDGPTLRHGIPLVMGVITAGTLAAKYEIPRRDYRDKSGYQREASINRVNRLVQELQAKAVDLPTGVLLNLREYDPSRHVSEKGGQKYIRPGDQRFYVVDGQHRVEALKRLVTTDAKKWDKFEVPFVCMLGASERQEMEQFYVVNSTAKSVRTDLALVLLKERAESDPEVMNLLVKRGESWKVKAQSLVEKMEQSSPLWRGRIRSPGQPKGTTTISSGGMVGSLKQLLDTPYFGESITIDNQLKILEAFWRAVNQLLPEAFENPAAYSLLKANPGVLVMHGLLVSAIEYVRSQGQSVIETESYFNTMKEVFDELEGETITGEPVRGSDFWRSGSAGAAGAYSGHGGRRLLLAKLKAYIPKIEVE